MSSINEYLKEGNKVEKITGKKIIIWGAGRNVRKMCSRLQLNGICCVIDSCKERIGTEIELYGNKYIIKNPKEIESYDENECVIIISTPLYADEIKLELSKKYKSRYLVCTKEECFLRGYKELRDMIAYDPIIQNKICIGNMSLYKDDLILSLSNAVENLDEEKSGMEFIPIHEGIRISFFVMINDEIKYCVHIPTKRYREGNSPSDPQCISEAYKMRMAVKPDKDVLVYLDENGVEITRFGNTQVNWTDRSVLKQAIEEIRRIHNTVTDISFERYPLTRITNKEKFLFELNGYYPAELSQDFHKSFDSELCKFVPKICNGDFHFGNIIEYNGRIQIIDWEWIGLSDPMWDVMHLHYTIKKILNLDYSIEEILSIYYGRCPSNLEIEHAKKTIVAIEYFSYLCSLAHFPQKNQETENRIKDIMCQFY